jgi:DNA-binding SARP family transcriptional activator
MGITEVGAGATKVRAALRIYILGPFRIEREGRPIPPREWARPKDRALLKLLALERGHLVPQDRLLDLLWPGLTPVAATNNLHVAVSRLRKLLTSEPPHTATAPRIIRRDGVGYTLASNGSVWTDLEEFRRRLGQGREWRRRGAWAPAVGAYRAAEALYRGDLFEEDPYEEWALRPREQLREMHLAFREELADCLIHLGLSGEAVEVCERGLADERTREGLYVQLMRAHGASGRLAEALQAYERCRGALIEELGVDPGPAVQAVHERLLRGEAPGTGYESEGHKQQTSGGDIVDGRSLPRVRPAFSADGQIHLPCVGREKELARLTSCLDGALVGYGQLALVHGEPGIGKSRLLEEFQQSATARGARVLVARCYEMERDLPYTPLVEALTTLLLERVDPAEMPEALGRWGPQLATLVPALRDLVPGLPPHRPLRPDAERAALLAGLTRLLLALGRRVPLVLLLDDLQWADDSTLQFLHYLARRLAGEPVMVVGFYRSGEVEPYHPLQQLLDSVADSGSAPQVLELACLRPNHVATLLPAVSGSAMRGRALATRLHRETEGHPLFLVETLRTLLETGVLSLDQQGVWGESSEHGPAPEPIREGKDRLPLPSSLREAILRRFGRLNDPERRLLTAAAVIERGFGPEVLAQMTGLALDPTLDGLEALVSRQFMRPAAGRAGFDFRHEMMREAVYADLSFDRRRSLHARAAGALEALAEGHPDALRQVAGELAYHCRQAERWGLAFRYALLAGDQAWDAFAPREALAHYRRAADVAERHPSLLDDLRRAELLERLGRAHADLGELEDAVRYFEALREVARGLGDRPLEGRALVALADAHFWRHDFGRAESLAAEALDLSKELDDRGLLTGTLVSATSVAMAQGRTNDAERHCRAALSLTGEQAPEEGNEEPVVAGARLNALGWVGLLRELQGDHDRALPAIEASLRLGQDLHNPFLTGRSRFALGMSLGNRGRYEEALATLKEALRLAEEAGDRYFLPRLPNTIGWIYSELGDLAQAEDWNRRSIAAGRETGWLEAEANARINLGSDAALRGNHRRAREEFERAAALIERDEWFTWRYRMRLLVGLGELALLDGAHERVLNFAQKALSLAEPTGSRKHAGRAWLLIGRALLAAGASPGEALAHMQRARNLARSTGHPALLWTSSAELAQLYSRLGRESEAAACRGEAVASVTTVADGIGDASLRRSLLGTPTIQAVLAGA